MTKKRPLQPSFNRSVSEAQAAHPQPPSIEAALGALGVSPVVRRKVLALADVSDLLRQRGAIHIWATDYFGHITQQLDQSASLDFWNRELKPRLYFYDGEYSETSLADHRAYVVHEWQSPFDIPLIEAKRVEVQQPRPLVS
jgi:hypothetical protein